MHRTIPPMWFDGNVGNLVVDTEAGPVYRTSLALAVFAAKVCDGEIIRFTYDHTDPETGTVTSGAARIVIEELPDPREEHQGQGSQPSTRRTRGWGDNQQPAPWEGRPPYDMPDKLPGYRETASSGGYVDPGTGCTPAAVPTGYTMGGDEGDDA